MKCPSWVSPNCACTGDCSAGKTFSYCSCAMCAIYNAQSQAIWTSIPSIPPVGSSWSSGPGGSGSTGQATWKPAGLVSGASKPPRAGKAGIAGFDGKGQNDFELAVGAVHGLRRWNFPVGNVLRGVLDRTPDASLLNLGGPPLLTGMTGLPWQPGVNEAKCNNYPGDHAPPVEFDEQRHQACGCGFWGYWQMDDSHIWKPDMSVIGIMKGTGRTLIGEKGFRSQRAELIAMAPGFIVDPGPERPRGSWPGYSFPSSHLDDYPFSPRTRQDDEEPSPDPRQEMAERKQHAEAWMGVLMDLLGTTYPAARVFATVRGMLASVPLGEIT